VNGVPGSVYQDSVLHEERLEVGRVEVVAEGVRDPQEAEVDDEIFLFLDEIIILLA
jgi:hypothetical protein